MSRPVLGVLVDALSPAPLTLVEGASGWLDLVWLADLSDPSVAAQGRAYRRFGTLLDTAGLTEAATLAAVREAGVHGVLAFNDRQLRTAAMLTAELGLPGHHPVTARALTDKYLQRLCLADAGLPVPGFWPVPRSLTSEQLAALAAQVRFPAVLKPRRGTSSRETHPVPDAAALQVLLDPDGPHALARRESFVLEEWLSGPETAGFADYVSVESISQDEIFTAVAVSGRFPLGIPFREGGNFVPSHLDAAAEASVVEAARRAAVALGVVDGALHTEVKLTPDGPRILEVNGRLGGGGVPWLVEQATGFPLLEAALRVAVGRPLPTARPAEIGDRIAYQYFHLVPAWAEQVTRLDGGADVLALPGVQDIFLNLRPGDAVDWREGSETFCCSVRGTASDHAELAGLPATVGRVLDVRYAAAGDSTGAEPGELSLGALPTSSSLSR